VLIQPSSFQISASLHQKINRRIWKSINKQTNLIFQVYQEVEYPNYSWCHKDLLKIFQNKPDGIVIINFYTIMVFGALNLIL